MGFSYYEALLMPPVMRARMIAATCQARAVFSVCRGWDWQNHQPMLPKEDGS